MMRHRFSSSLSTPEPGAGQDLDLPSLIAARICHDLISPLGAIGNGLELLQMGGTCNGPEIDLVRESVQQAQARMRLFRLGFGAIRHGQMIGSEEMNGVLKGYAATARFDLQWSMLDSQPKIVARSVILALLCVETALPYGGHVTVTQDEQLVLVTARSDRLKIDHGPWNALKGETGWPDDLRAAMVQFPMLQRAVAELGGTLDVSLSADSIALRIIAA